MDILIVNKGKCKCSMSTMTKYGLDYFCNRCHKPVFGITDDDFTDNEYMEELRAELDAEARMENEGYDAQKLGEGSET